MRVDLRQSLTLVELLIAISLLAVMILGVSNIDVFSRYHLITTDHRAKLQNDVSLCLEHMTKKLSGAIGNETLYGANSAVFISPNSTNTAVLSVLADANGSGQRELIGGDYWIGYNFDSSAKQFRYCGQCTSSLCSSCSVAQEVLARNITAFSASKDFSRGNYINVTLTACSDPTGATASCGSSNNPAVTMSTSITLPAVAAN
ncbi:MAG: hypothetical protein V1869_00795 [Candidatus Omnitrophota bacterium]